MFSIDLLRELYRHMAWADRKVWETVPNPAAAAADDRLRDLLLHIHIVQRAFLHVWTDQPILFPEAREFPTLASLRAWALPYYAEAAAFLLELDERRLAEPVTMPWVRHFEQRLGRGFETPTVADTMFQVTSHSTHHRGQVNARLRELGVEPPLVDYIAWVWFGKPGPEGAAEVVRT